MQQLLMLDLRDDPALIAAYEAHHRAVWPAVLAHLRRQGVTRLALHRLGNRLVMLLETDDAVFDAQRMRRAEAEDPTLKAWEDLMRTFQAPTPWTPAGVKWVPMAPLFDWHADRPMFTGEPV